MKKLNNTVKNINQLSESSPHQGKKKRNQESKSCFFEKVKETHKLLPQTIEITLISNKMGITGHTTDIKDYRCYY